MRKYINIVILTVSVLSLVGCGDAGSKKWQLNNKNPTQEEVATLKLAIAMKDDYIKKGAKWSEADGYFFSEMLKYFPEYAKECDKVNGWSKFDGSDWCNLLSDETRFEKKCDENQGWKVMSPDDWSFLLSKQPKYKSKADEYKAWDKFTSKDWTKILLGKNDILVKKCHSLNVLQKFNKNEWISLLLADASFTDKADENGIWKQLKNDDWSKLIAKNDKFIDIAKREKIFDTFDNDTWLAMIEANPKLQKVAKDNGVFKKFTPIDWANLQAKDPKYMNLFKSVNSLDKLSNRSLIRLYCEQPSLRNKIFALNRIDIDVAKKIDNIYNNFGDNGSSLDVNSLIVILKIFPDLKNNINEQTFQNYDKESWMKLLGGDKKIYNTVLKEYAYVVPWKKFTFSNWCELLDKNTDFLGLFKRNVDLKKLECAQIQRALLEAELNNISTFKKYDFWKDFTKEQYIELIQDKNNSSNNERIMVLTRNSLKKLKDLGMHNGAKDSISCDYKYIFSKAEENKIIAQFNENDWEVIVYDSSSQKDKGQSKRLLKNQEKLNFLAKKFFEAAGTNSKLRKEIIKSNNFSIIDGNNLWSELKTEQWAPLIKIYRVEENPETMFDVKRRDEIKRYFENLGKNQAIENFPEEDLVTILKAINFILSDTLCKKEDLKKQKYEAIKCLDEVCQGFWDKIPTKVWVSFFKSNHVDFREQDHPYHNTPIFMAFIEKAKINEWSKEDILNLKNYAESGHILKSEILEKIDINKVDIKDAWVLIKYHDKLWYKAEKLTKLSPMEILSLLGLKDDFSVDMCRKLLEINEIYKELSPNDKEIYLSMLYHMALGDRMPFEAILRNGNFDSRISVYCSKCKKTLKKTIVEPDSGYNSCQHLFIMEVKDSNSTNNDNISVNNNIISTSMPTKEESNVSKQLKKELEVLGF